MAAPCSNGRDRIGAAVLSTISGMPNSRPMRGDLGDREDRELGIGQGLGVIGAGALIGGAAEIFRVGRIDEADFNALILERIGEEVPGAAVEIGRGDDIVADAGEVLHRKGRRGLSRRDAERRHSAFQRGQPLFQNVGGRDCPDPRVDIAQFLQREQIGRVFGVAELVAGGLVDRHGAPRRWPDRRANRHGGRWSRDFWFDWTFGFLGGCSSVKLCRDLI